MKCEKCGNEHDGSYGSGRFCSSQCARAFSASNCSKIKFQHLNKVHIALRANYGRWKCKYCDYIANTRAKLILHNKKLHKNIKRIAWNNGLTKETSNVILNASIKISRTLKGKGHCQSIKTREHLSNIRSAYLDKNNAGFKDVKWLKVKNLNGIEYSVRGHWEENVAIRLNELGILWNKAKAIPYFDGNLTRHYSPDFWLPQFKSYIEVKGYYSNENIQKMKFILEQYPTIKIYFLYKQDYFDFVTKKIMLNYSLIMNLKNEKFWR